ncbi:hypothetical protein Tco_1375135, partial [Tanacetum coccineum]
MAAHLMTILEKSILHEEFREVDHHEMLIEGASYSREVDRGEPVRSAGLRAASAGTGETTLGGGLKNSSNMSWNKISQSFFVSGTYGIEEGRFGSFVVDTESLLCRNVVGIKRLHDDLGVNTAK